MRSIGLFFVVSMLSGCAALQPTFTPDDVPQAEIAWSETVTLPGRDETLPALSD